LNISQFHASGQTPSGNQKEAVAAARPALGDVGFAMERHATFATVTGAGVNFYFVDEHEIIPISFSLLISELTIQ
jgi:hypothetical protein